MTFILWKEEYDTGIEEIDAQHKQLVYIINELNDTRQAGDSQETLDGILSKLVDYTKYHFSAEEEVLEKLSYAKLEEHTAKHQIFINQIEVMLAHYSDEKSDIDDMLMIFMRSWLSNHILIDDKDALSGKMTLIPWRERYNTGVEEIDAQHKQLVGIINELHDSSQAGDSQETLHAIFIKLIDYAKYHFDTEEALMNRLNYSKQEEHKVTHQMYMNECKRVLKFIEDGKVIIEDKFITHLKNDYLQHITTEDMDVFSFEA